MLESCQAKRTFKEIIIKPIHCIIEKYMLCILFAVN